MAVHLVLKARRTRLVCGGEESKKRRMTGLGNRNRGLPARDAETLVSETNGRDSIVKGVYHNGPY